ncbi:MAG: thioredoxin-disulfide reductase [Deltaproteobacteria bacterium]|nr:MAG: thioredoxin-disulfide reductase [Deltaproteobacteria bacterium]
METTNTSISTPDKNDAYDLIIIGGGPGGLTAGIYAMRSVMKTMLIEKGALGGQMTVTDAVDNWPGTLNISGHDLSENFAQHAQDYGLQIVNGEVVAVEPGQQYHAIRLADGTVYHTHAAIIATGGSPKKLNIPGEDENYGKGVSYCAVCDGFFFRNKTVVVIGGGNSAAEESLYLAKLATKVYLVHRRDALRADKIMQERIFAEEKIEVVWDTIPKEVLSDEQGVNGVLVENVKSGEQRRITTDGVFIFIGFSPNNSMVPEGTILSPDGYVSTDNRGEISTPGIFVVGDLRDKYAKQIVIAAGEGATAALAAAHFVDLKKNTTD